MLPLSWLICFRQKLMLKHYKLFGQMKVAKRHSKIFPRLSCKLSCLLLSLCCPFVRCGRGRNKSFFMWLCGCLYVQKTIFPFLSAAWWNSSNIPRRKVLCSRCWADFWPITFFLVRSKEPTWSPAFICNQVSSIFNICFRLGKNAKHVFYQYFYPKLQPSCLNTCA